MYLWFIYLYLPSDGGDSPGGFINHALDLVTPTSKQRYSGNSPRSDEEPSMNSTYRAAMHFAFPRDHEETPNIDLQYSILVEALKRELVTATPRI